MLNNENLVSIATNSTVEWVVNLTESIVKNNVMLLVKGSSKTLLNPLSQYRLARTSGARDTKNLFIAVEKLHDFMLNPVARVLGAFKALEDLVVESTSNGGHLSGRLELGPKGWDSEGEALASQLGCPDVILELLLTVPNGGDLLSESGVKVDLDLGTGAVGSDLLAVVNGDAASQTNQVTEQGGGVLLDDWRHVLQTPDLSDGAQKHCKLVQSNECG